MTLLVLGLGNRLLGDDGIGLEAADCLRRRLGGAAEVRTTSQSGLYLLEHLEGHEEAIIIDAVLGDSPGRVRELAAVEVKATVVPSAHYAGLPEALAIARQSGLAVPQRLRIFAVEIGGTQVLGAGLSPEVEAAIPEVVRRVMAAAGEWGHRVDEDGGEADAESPGDPEGGRMPCA